MLEALALIQLTSISLHGTIRCVIGGVSKPLAIIGAAAIGSIADVSAAAGADMPRNSFTESKNERDAALVPDANVAADTSNIKTNEIRPIRRNFDDLLIAEEWDDGVIELSDFLDINN